MKTFLVIGCRPNFMKVGPIYQVLKRTKGFKPIIIHTGQHYDYELSKVFFKDLELPKPHHFLGVGSCSHARQTGRVMVRFEDLLTRSRPDLVVVVGDTNSTLGAALAVAKVRCQSYPWPKLLHVEAGLRSNDLRMPEEVNRRVVDHISDLLFTPTKGAGRILRREGVSKEKIFHVGNVMIDGMQFVRQVVSRSAVVKKLGLKKNGYVLLTLHRAENVDDPTVFKKIWRGVCDVAEMIPVIFPIHPRTKRRISRGRDGIIVTRPLRYSDFIKLMKYARFVMTDSGGIQVETTYLRIPCLTLRERTEWQITLKAGTNRLVGIDPDLIVRKARIIMERGLRRKRVQIPLWDGRSAPRIVQVLERFI